MAVRTYDLYNDWSREPEMDYSLVKASSKIRQFATWQEENYYTPDIPFLESFNWHYVFVYGTLRSSFCRESMLKDNPFVGFGFTHKPEYCMYTTQYGSRPNYPAVFEADDLRGEVGAKVFGQIYLADAKKIMELDRMESQGVLYFRRPIPIDITGGPQSGKTISCLTYIGNPVNILRKNYYIKMKEVSTHRNTAIGQYYHFTSKDQNPIEKGI